MTKSGEYHWFNNEKNIFYLSTSMNLDDLLWELAKKRNYIFNFNDYEELCRNGKISISKDILHAKDEEIRSLRIKLERMKGHYQNDSVTNNASNYEEAVKEFMGEGFEMPYDKIKQEHIITRYRCIIFLKNRYRLSSFFNEKAFIQSERYQAIELEDGTKVHVQGAKYGVWYISPNVWRDIVVGNSWMCLCIGNRDSDFIVITNREKLQSLANESNSVVIRVRGDELTDNMETLSRVFPGEFGGGQVQLLLKLHDTPNKDINQMFDAAFNNESNYDDL